MKILLLQGCYIVLSKRDLYPGFFIKGISLSSGNFNIGKVINVKTGYFEVLWPNGNINEWSYNVLSNKGQNHEFYAATEAEVLLYWKEPEQLNW